MKLTLSLAMLLAVAGCDRSGVAYVDIENTQGWLMPASPIEIDPAVQVYKNEVRIDGMDVRQHIKISGPIKIVPSDTAPWLPAQRAKAATQPATQPIRR